ncbi:MAG: Stp1/IreP family PP2C-type Ser/Thr phosphatase [bacterium]
MTCSSCGKANPNEAQFCISCGKPILIEEEITARFERSDLVPYEIPPLEVFPEVTFGAKTDLGKVRDHNEDKFDFYEPNESELLAARGKLYMVCDGMGGHAAGQIASELACKTFISEYFGPITANPVDAARKAIQEANRYIYEVGQTIREREGMGTTVTALLLCQSTAYIAHVGDSRCYLYREGQIRQVSLDHTWVAEQVNRGLMTEEDASMSPFAHVITRACGAGATVEVDVYEELLKEGDLFVLCSDGLTNHLSEAEIAEIISQNAPSPASVKLVQKALDYGGSDNCTVMVVRVDSIQQADQ